MQRRVRSQACARLEINRSHENRRLPCASVHNTGPTRSVRDDRLRRGVDASWTFDGRGGGRRGSNPQLQPWEGASPFLNSIAGDNRLKRSIHPIFERCRVPFGGHRAAIKVAGTQVIRRRRRRHPRSGPGSCIRWSSHNVRARQTGVDPPGSFKAESHSGSMRLDPVRFQAPLPA